MVKRALLIAFHYPPLHGSSGIQRTLKFSRYLPDFGWEPLVLSAHPRAYEKTSASQMGDIPEDTVVKRAFALDTARHLALRGAYPRSLALPDRWISWWLGAVPAGLRLIRQHNPQVIWTTYPIATAHLIGLSLSRLTGIPWVADFRDSMTEDAYPRNPAKRRIYRWIERHAVNRCAKAVFTTPGAVRMYQERYPQLPPDRFVEIANGYDEENFAQAARLAALSPDKKGPLVLVHSGIIYPSERDPRPLFGAIAALRQAGRLQPGELRIVLRATGEDDYLGTLIRDLNIGDVVELAPAVPYQEALSEMLAADGLLVLQAANCNHQIPAKVYEYLRSRRPILALTDPAGDTAATLAAAGVDSIVPLDSKEAIMEALPRFLQSVREGQAPLPTDTTVAGASRRARSQELAQLFDSLL